MNFWHLRHAYHWLYCMYIMDVFISFDTFNFGYFTEPCNIACSMQHMPLTYPRSCKKLLFHIPLFGRKVSLIFLVMVIWPDQQFDLFDDLNPFELCQLRPCIRQLTLWGYFSCFMGSWLLNFTEDRHVLILLIFWALFNTSDINITVWQCPPQWIN